MLQRLSKNFARAGARSFSAAENHYDLICLGGGSGGLFCALKAQSFGKKACIIDKYKLGGRCVHSGCIPKKILYHGTMIRREIDYGPDYGVTCKNPLMDWKKIKNAQEAFIDEMYKKRSTQWIPTSF